MRGIVAFGVYLPSWRLARSAAAQVLGLPPAGKGTRSVASYDEDATSMGVEAARPVLRAGGQAPESVLFATVAPPYLDKTNATAVHAALGLPDHVPAYDMVGSVRSAAGALRFALEAPRPSLAVTADVRTGLPGGADEVAGGDGAAAFLCGTEGVIAEHLGSGSATAEFLERWRTPGEPASKVWEDRFGERAYGPLVEAALADACKQSGIALDDVDHLVVAGLHARAVRTARAKAGVRPEAVADDLATVVGNLGAAQPGLLLADALERATPGQVIVLLTIADGAEALVFRTTDALAARPTATTVREAAAAGTALDYARFLTWRGLLRREPPRRPDPLPPSAPPAYRNEPWKFAFTASKCEECGTRHLPPHRVCMSCRAVDRMVPERLADVQGTIATYTVDRLAFSLSPPVVVGVVDFDGGGRFQCELTDVDPAAVAIGDRVEMTFRRLYTADGVHNYFWKARPLRGGQGG